MLPNTKVFDFYPKNYPLSEVIVIFNEDDSPKFIDFAQKSAYSVIIIPKTNRDNKFFVFFLSQIKENFNSPNIIYLDLHKSDQRSWEEIVSLRLFAAKKQVL